jgi:predicted regulator of Ras-like GTPase activity (Roadblock/LC7/MglB family)/Tfp pilus assembly protein PilF
MAKEEAEIKELSKKLAQNPDSMVFVQLADAYRRAGDLERSIEVCLRGLERHPTYTTARAILGRNYFDLNRLEEAAAEFRQIEVADPENILAHRMLGQIYLQQGNFAEAIVRQQKVLALDPDDTTAQELLQRALQGAKEAEGGRPTSRSTNASTESSASGTPEALVTPPKAPAESLGTLKVADIYIKKGALDEAAEVLQEILASDPGNAIAQQRLREVNERRGAGKKAEEEAARKAEEEARRKAEEEARRKAEEEAKRKAEEEAARKAEEEAKRKAEEEARRKAEEEAKRKAEEEARRKAEEEAKRKAEEEARRKAEEEAKRKAEEEAARKAEEEAKRKAEEEARRKAEEEAKRKAEEEARRKAEEEAKRKAEEEAARKAEEEARKASKLSSEDILSVMAVGADDLIEEDAPAPKSKEAELPKAAPSTPLRDAGVDPAVAALIDEFVRAQSIESCFLLDKTGAVLDGRHAGASGDLGQTAATIFNNTGKAAQRMNFGGLRQIMIVGEDGRQILFVALKAGTLVALTGKATNLGLLRVAVNDLVKRA